MKPLLTYCLLSIRRTFSAHVPLYVCAILFCALTSILTTYWDVPVSLNASLFFLETVPVFVVLAIGLAASRQLFNMLRKGVDRPAPAMATWMRDGFFSGDRPGNAFHSMITFTPMMISFAALKNDIPLIEPFSWDRTFAHWDELLTFGHTPWQLLQPLLGHPPITATINFVYDLWFVVMFGSLIAQAFAWRGSALRMQFLLAFAFSWFMAGNLLALAFSSAGPCFYGMLHLPNDPYLSQMQYLRSAAEHWPVGSVAIQDTLWRLYQHGNFAFGGISAMPSMHVTIAVVVMMLGWRIGKRTGSLLTIFTALIMIGAVRLGWHYLVDVLAGAVLGFIFWYAAGWIALKYETRMQARGRSANEPELAPAGALS
jgi:membrane-associated phospholipid phosphatase